MGHGDVERDPSNPGEAVSDRSLLRRFRGGQADASTLLYLRYASRLHGLAIKKSSADLARRVDPDEIVQSVFRTFFRRVAQGHYDVPDGEEIWKLLLVIALNKVRSAAVHHRAAKRDIGRTSAGVEYDRAIESAEAGDDMALDRPSPRDRRRARRAGPDQRARMIELRIEGYEVAEIAETAGRSKRSVEPRPPGLPAPARQADPRGTLTMIESGGGGRSPSRPRYRTTTSRRSRRRAPPLRTSGPTSTRTCPRPGTRRIPRHPLRGSSAWTWSCGWGPRRGPDLDEYRGRSYPDLFLGLRPAAGSRRGDTASRRSGSVARLDE